MAVIIKNAGALFLELNILTANAVLLLKRIFNPPLSPFYPLYVNAFSSFFLLLPVLSFLSVVRKLTQQSKRVVTSRVQSVYFVSEVLPLALHNLLKNFCTIPFDPVRTRS